ncbi:kinase-like domain-containing protein [Roridomyces roridus]|uniref:non-specific serine/threonine protein kinase n=1 Tax=Roridomyces roridus TaxID=1738132 RepID=A0AAD7BDV2_9AGAR|nr:kinase-like domain-containing protein [Roridomyces roridus]
MSASSDSDSDSEYPFLYEPGWVDWDGEGENIERYSSGGLHPVHLNDFFPTSSPGSEGYRILHKLGYGGFSHVWYGQNLRHGGAALKFIASDQTGKTLEVEINNFLASRSKEEPGFHNVALCLETFQVNGPNGIHDVIATEPALRMSSVLYTSAMDSLDDRVVFRQTLAGLGFIHKHGFVHRDLHVGNIAIEFPFLRTAGVAAIMQSTGHPVCHALLPMAPTSNPPPLPTYVVESAKFCQHFTLTNADTQCFVVKIIDFGCSFRPVTDEPPNPYHHGPPKPPECNLLEMIPGRRLPSTPEDVPENSSNNHPWSELLESERGSTCSGISRCLGPQLVCARRRLGHRLHPPFDPGTE